MGRRLSRIFGAIACACLLAKAGCGPSQGPAAAGPSSLPAVSDLETSSLRVATYNINWGNLHLDEVARAIRESDADVIALQETNPQSEAWLRRQFAGVYPHLAVGGEFHRGAAGGFGVLSKWPIAGQEFVPAKQGLFGFHVVQLAHGSRNVTLIAVHLQPVLVQQARGTGDLLGYYKALETAEKTHAQEINEILSRVAVDRAIILAGDFNSCATFQAPQRALKHGLIDSFASAHAEPESHPTWHWPIRTGEIALRIDYLFHTPALRTVSSRVIRTDGSDHYLLTSKLEFVD